MIKTRKCLHCRKSYPETKKYYHGKGKRGFAPECRTCANIYQLWVYHKDKNTHKAERLYDEYKAINSTRAEKLMANFREYSYQSPRHPQFWIHELIERIRGDVLQGG